jgi:hypothetical protein
MKALLSRVKRLEAQWGLGTAPIWRSGVVWKLPDNYVGERHIKLVSQMPTDSPNRMWCVFAERPGAGPNEAEGADIVMYFDENDAEL